MKILWSIYDKYNPGKNPVNSIFFTIIRFIDFLIPWKLLGLERPLIAGDLYEILDKGILRFVLDKARQNKGKEYVRLRIFHLPMILILEAEKTKEILHKNLNVVRRGISYDRLVLFFGKGIFTNRIESRWKHQRKAVFKLMKLKKMQQYSEELYTLCMDAIDTIRLESKNNKVDLVSLLSKMGLIAFCKIYLGVDVSDNPSELIKPLNRLLVYVNGSVEIITIPFGSRYNNFMRDRNFVHNYMRKLIERARKNKSGDPDLLEYLNDPNLTEEELIEFMISIVLGSHETTARLMLGIIYAMMHHPDCVEKLRKELKDNNIKEPLSHDILELEYLENIINEGTRLFSPVWLISREPSKNIQIDDLKIKKGTQMLLSPMVVHRSEKIWGKDCEVFNPDRYDTMDNEKKKLLYPFILGPESCAGKKFALLEASLVIAGIFLKYDLTIVKDIITPKSAGTFRLTDHLDITMTPVQ